MNAQTYLEQMVQQYAETALWSSVYTMNEGDDYIPFDQHHDTDDIATETWAEFWQDCAAFLSANLDDLKDMDPGQAGHDFWLTREGHGAGFWDRGLGDRGDRLTDACKAYGEVYLYIGDDGRIHHQ